jgi:hypothetical protein
LGAAFILIQKMKMQDPGLFSHLFPIELKQALKGFRKLITTSAVIAVNSSPVMGLNTQREHSVTRVHRYFSIGKKSVAVVFSFPMSLWECILNS